MTTKVFIQENSFIAKVAAAKMKSKAVAIVVKKTIYLHGISKQDFLRNASWVAHELTHIEQYEKYGFVFFWIKYLLEWIIKGYENISFEIEARANESNISLAKQYTFH